MSSENMVFMPNYEIISKITPAFFSIKDLEKEIGVYSATPEFIIKNCGDISKLILSNIPNSYYEEAERLKLYPNCDIRIHRLYPSDYPAYPGWHCDGEYRETYFSQPDLNKIKVSKHIVCTVSSHKSGVSNCQFLNEPFMFNNKIEDKDFKLWQKINEKLESKPTKTIFDTSDGDMILFDNFTLHRVMPAKIRGWRLFFRMSMWHKKNIGDNGGMITKQEQVYKYLGDNGW